MNRKVVIVGGGVAGLEALMALHDLAGDRAEVTLVAPDPDFLYKPLLVEEPFDLGPAEKRALAPLAEELGARFVMKAVTGVRPEEHTVELDDGSTLDYDYLIVCAGGRFRPALERARTFPSGGEPLRINELLQGGQGRRRVAFVVPSGVTWALPIYEIALMTQRRAIELGVDDVELTIVTPEEAPLAIFGPTASAAVAQLLSARGIEVETGAHASEGDSGLILRPGDRRIEADSVIALPAMDGPALPGLPQDEHGFIPIDQHARVTGVDDVYAAGDGTNFPIKQGGLGTQQADAAAAHIAERLGAAIDVETFHPVLRGKLITGDESLHLRADVAGGGGGDEASLDCLWWPPHKISGRYLAPFLYHDAQQEPEPPGRSLDVEVLLPREWHAEPMALDPYKSPEFD